MTENRIIIAKFGSEKKRGFSIFRGEEVEQRRAMHADGDVEVSIAEARHAGELRRSLQELALYVQGNMGNAYPKYERACAVLRSISAEEDLGDSIYVRCLCGTPMAPGEKVCSACDTALQADPVPDYTNTPIELPSSDYQGIDGFVVSTPAGRFRFHVAADPSEARSETKP